MEMNLRPRWRGEFRLVRGPRWGRQRHWQQRRWRACNQRDAGGNSDKKV